MSTDGIQKIGFECSCCIFFLIKFRFFFEIEDLAQWQSAPGNTGKVNGSIPLFYSLPDSNCVIGLNKGAKALTFDKFFDVLIEFKKI